MGLIDAFVDAHNHRRNIENPGKFWDCMKGENPLHDGNHSGLCSRVPVNLPDETFPWFQVRNFVCWMPRLDIRISPMLVPQHAKEAMTFRDGPSTLTGELALLMVTHLPDGVLSQDLLIEG